MLFNTIFENTRNNDFSMIGTLNRKLIEERYILCTVRDTVQKGLSCDPHDKNSNENKPKSLNIRIVERI